MKTYHVRYANSKLVKSDRFQEGNHFQSILADTIKHNCLTSFLNPISQLPVFYQLRNWLINKTLSIEFVSDRKAFTRILKQNSKYLLYDNSKERQMKTKVVNGYFHSVGF